MRDDISAHAAERISRLQNIGPALGTQPLRRCGGWSRTGKPCRKADLRSRSAAPDSGPPRITVLIPAHNEAATIGQTIRSLRRQTIPVSSITVMCDNCTDDTAQIAEALGVNVMVTTLNTARKAGALNQALARVLPTLGADDLVLTMDADSALSPALA